MPAIRAAAAGPRALGGDGQKTRVLARDLFDAAARHRTELVHALSYGVRCVILQTSASTRSIHTKSGRALVPDPCGPPVLSDTRLILAPDLKALVGILSRKGLECCRRPFFEGRGF